MADKNELAARLHEMSVRFLARSRVEAGRLEVCLRDLSPPNVATIRGIAHDLAGAGGTFGFPEISRLALSLEDATTTNAPDRIADFGRALVDEVRRQSGGT